MSLRFVEIRVQQRAVVLTNTDRAVHVEVTRRDGSTYRVWVERGGGERCSRALAPDCSDILRVGGAGVDAVRFNRRRGVAQRLGDDRYWSELA